MKISGPNIFVLMTLLFTGLKLTGHITWSWWAVCAPMLLHGGFFLVLFSLVILAKVWVSYK